MDNGGRIFNFFRIFEMIMTEIFGFAVNFLTKNTDGFINIPLVIFID